MSDVLVKATAKKQICTRYAVKCFGVKLAVAFDRDSGGKVGYDAKMIAGNIDSGGSRTNWDCVVDEGSIFEFKVDADIFEANKNRLKNWDVEIIEKTTQKGGLMNAADLG